MSRFLEKQLEHAEAVKLGRVENYCDYDEKTKSFVHGQRRSDSAKTPALTTQEEFPVGKKRGVVKPGQE